VAVPTLSVGGYYDQEDMYGPQEEYARLEPHDDQHQNFLVLGPWRHGYWARPRATWAIWTTPSPSARSIVPRSRPSSLAHYLKDESGFDLEDTASFQTGSNTWKRYSHFPPKNPSHQPAFAGRGPAQLDRLDDPGQDHLPERSGPTPSPIAIGPSSHLRAGLPVVQLAHEDQRFVTDRKDLALWKLPVLKKDLVVTGEVQADIFASTTGTDNDLVVKLIDQYPDDDPDAKMRGYQLMTNAEIFRGRYLDSFEKAAPLRANSIRDTASACTMWTTSSRSDTPSWSRSRAPGSALRPQPTDLCAQHHDGQARGLQAGHYYRLLRPRARLQPAVAADERLRPHRVLLILFPAQSCRSRAKRLLLSGSTPTISAADMTVTGVLRSQHVSLRSTLDSSRPLDSRSRVGCGLSQSSPGGGFCA